MDADISLINKVKSSNDPECLKELIHRHSGIYINIVNKYLPDSLEGVNKQDVLEDKDFCIYDAALNFDEGKKTKFGTYIGNLARWRCLNLYNKKIKFPQTNINEVFNSRTCDKGGIEELQSREDLKNVFRILESVEDERVKKIFEMRYNSDNKLTPWKNIAKRFDLSIQGVINIHNKYIEEIQKRI